MDRKKLKCRDGFLLRQAGLLFAIGMGVGLGFGLGLGLGDPVAKSVATTRNDHSDKSEMGTNLTNVTNITDIANMTNITSTDSIAPSTPIFSTNAPIYSPSLIPSMFLNQSGRNDSITISNNTISQAPSLSHVSHVPTISSPNDSSMLPSLSPIIENITHLSSIPTTKPSQLLSNTILYMPSSSPSQMKSIIPTSTNRPSINSSNNSFTSPTIVSSSTPTNTKSILPAHFPSSIPSKITSKSLAPTGEPLTRDEIVMILTSVSNLDSLNDRESHQHQALSWMMENVSFTSDFDTYQIKQKYILAVIYYATNGEQWIHQYDFLSDSHECQWKGSPTGMLSGVQECDDKFHITKLSLVSVGMVGTIPKEIGYLTSLESLNFSENVLEGGIPIDTFRFLTNLQVARFKSNFLSGDVTPLCEAWEENIKVFHVDRDQITCPCCSCCPFDS